MTVFNEGCIRLGEVGLTANLPMTARNNFLGYFDEIW